MPFKESFEPVALKNSNLFRPLQLGSITLDSRVVLSPMTRLRADHGVPTDLMIEYYKQRSTRKGSLLITEGAFISAAAGGYDSAPGIYSDEQVEKWKPIFKTIHDNKSFVFVQLWALGRSSFPSVLARDRLRFVSASDDCYEDEESKKNAIDSNNRLHGLTKDEVRQYIADYVHSAKNSLKAGADGVEVHAANGYLPNQFLDPKSNMRNDEYGGSIENRARFTLDVIDALINAIGADKVGVRLSPYGVNGAMSGIEEPTILAHYAYVIGELEKRGKTGHRLAYIHVMEPMPTKRISAEGVSAVNASNDFIYSIWNGNVIRAGDYATDPQRAERDVEKGQTALAYGRFFISNPDLPDRLYDGKKLNDYNYATFYTSTSDGYTDYPTYEEAITNGFTDKEFNGKVLSYKEALKKEALEKDSN